MLASKQTALMNAPNQETIGRLRTAVLSIRSAAAPLEHGDVMRREIEDAAAHVECIIGSLKRFRDNR